MGSLSSLLARSENRLAGIVWRLGWGVLDQGVSSISNFAVSLVVAHALGATGFGAFSIAFLTYTVVLNASRGLSTDPLLVRYSGRPDDRWRHAAASSCAVAMAVGVLAGALCVVTGLVVGDEVGIALVAIGIGMPLLMVQDATRFCFFAIGRGDRALLIDLVWTVPVIVGLFALGSIGPTTVNCIVVFELTAGLAAVFGLVLCRAWPDVRTIGPWLRAHRDLGSRYLVENLASGSVRQVRAVVLGAAAGLAAVGILRGSEILMGPFFVILMGIAAASVPEASKVLARAPHRLVAFALGLGGAQAVLAALWAAAMAVILPAGLGQLMLGDIWRPAYALLLPTAIATALGCFATAANAAVRALGAANRSLCAQLISASSFLIGGVVGALVDGAAGCAWGCAIASVVGVAGWFWQLRLATAAHLATLPAEPADVVLGAVP